MDRAHLEGLEVSPPGSPPSRAQKREVAIREEKKGCRGQPLAPEQLDLLVQREEVVEQKPHCQGLK